MNTGKWRFVWTPTAASTDAAWGGGFYALFASSGTPSGSDLGGMWISGDALQLYNQSEVAVINRALTWSAGATITITIDVANSRYSISGATTGNATDQSFTP